MTNYFKQEINSNKKLTHTPNLTSHSLSVHVKKTQRSLKISTSVTEPMLINLAPPLLENTIFLQQGLSQSAQKIQQSMDTLNASSPKSSNKNIGYE